MIEVTFWQDQTAEQACRIKYPIRIKDESEEKSILITRDDAKKLIIDLRHHLDLLEQQDSANYDKF